MLTVSASSSHSSDTETNRSTTPAATAAPTSTTSHRRAPRSKPPAIGARAGASGATVMACTVTAGFCGSGGLGGSGRVDSRHDLGDEPLETLGAGEVAKPEHELPATRVDVGLHLLRDALGRADQVVTRVGVGENPPPQVPAFLGAQPPVEVGIGVEESAVGGVRAGDRVVVTSQPIAVLAQRRRLVHEAVEPDLPVGGVGVLGRDAQRDLCLLYTSDAADDLLCVD